MKMVNSLLLSIAMLIGTLSASVNAYAVGFVEDAKSVELNTVYTDFYSEDDPIVSMAINNYCYRSYRFTIPQRGKIRIFLESKNDAYFAWSIYIYSANNLTDYILWSTHNADIKYNSEKGTYYNYVDVNLEKGTYFLVKEYCNQYNYSSTFYGTYDIQFSYSPSISKPTSLKVSSRSTSSLGLTWGKVGDIDGYQLQRKSGDSWNTLTNTTSNSYTVSSLKSGTKYDFRVRSYVDVEGTKYYSGWKTLTTATKPSTPSIKNPSTNKKHQIIAKWNTVSACTGYQVQYSKKKNFSSVITTKTVSGKSKTSYTGKNFTKGKTYYVRVRAYKTVDGTKYYSSWSKVKSIKCK